MLLAVCTMSAACSASITSFTATPRIFCPDTQAIVLNWAAAGRTSLAADPPAHGPRGLGAVPSTGTLTIAGADLSPSSETVVTLTASRFIGGATHNQQRLVPATHPSAVTASLDMGPNGGDIACDSQHRELVGAFVFEPSEYDDHIVIRQLRNDAARPLTVAHRDRAWTIAAGQVADLAAPTNQPDSSVLTGGIWVVSAPLLDGEQCGALLPRQALSLPLHPTMNCGAR